MGADALNRSGNLGSTPAPGKITGPTIRLVAAQQFALGILRVERNLSVVESPM
jgi:hypothetical protein